MTKSQILKLVNKVFSSGNLILGNELKNLEKNFSKYIGNKFAVGVNSGTDALTLGLHLLGVRRGDEVITVPNSFVASVSVIVHLGAKPVFIDVLPDQNMNPELLEKAITKKSKVI